MKNKFLFFITAVILVTVGCSMPSPSPGKYSFIHRLSDSLHLNKEKNILIYSINPNDCINCLHGFVDIDRNLQKVANSKMYVMLMEREIEKQELIRTTQSINFKDSINKVVIWNKDVYQQISTATNNKLLVSLFTVYNYKQDSVLYSKPIKSIADVRELNVYLDK